MDSIRGNGFRKEGQKCLLSIDRRTERNALGDWYRTSRQTDQKDAHRFIHRALFFGSSVISWKIVLRDERTAVYAGTGIVAQIPIGHLGVAPNQTDHPQRQNERRPRSKSPTETTFITFRTIATMADNNEDELVDYDEEEVRRLALLCLDLLGNWEAEADWEAMRLDWILTFFLSFSFSLFLSLSFFLYS